MSEEAAEADEECKADCPEEKDEQEEEDEIADEDARELSGDRVEGEQKITREEIEIEPSAGVNLHALLNRFLTKKEKQNERMNTEESQQKRENEAKLSWKRTHLNTCSMRTGSTKPISHVAANAMLRGRGGGTGEGHDEEEEGIS